MRFTTYSKYHPELADEVNLQGLLDQLGDFLLQSGFAGGSPSFWHDDAPDGERSMESLRQAILQALMDSGRYPVSIYPSWLRLIVTFLVPIAVATTVPMQGLRGDLGPAQVLLFIGIGGVVFFVATRIWKAGIRQYSGASS